MAHYSDVIRDEQYGTAIARLPVTVLDAAGTLADLTDDSAQPLANPVFTDDYGLLEFNTDDAVYLLEYRLGGKLIRVDSRIIGNPPEYKGDTGLAANTFNDLAIFKAASTAEFKAATLSGVSGVTDGQFYFETANAPYTADPQNVLKADDTALAVGAWVRQGADKVAFHPDGVGAVVQPLAARVGQEMLLSDFLPIGFTTSGGTDYTAAIQAAFDAAATFNRTLKLIPGIFDHTGVTAPAELNVVGQGQYTSILRSLTGGSITLAGELCAFRDIGVIGQGGHLFTQSAAVGRNLFVRVNCLQGSDGFSVFDNAGFASIRNVFHDCYVQHTLTATVPTFNFVGPGGSINNNMWLNHWAQTSGEYHINIETTDDNAQYGNVVRGFVGEVCAGGGIRMAGAKQFILEDIHCWDISLAPGGALLKDFIRIERGNAGAYPDGQRATSIGKIDGYTRLDSGIAIGVFDISLPDAGGGAGIQISNVSSASDNLQIDLQGNRIYATFPEGTVDLFNRDDATTYDPVTGLWAFPDFSRLSIGGDQVLGPRVTGFGTIVGTGNPASILGYLAPAISNPPTQAEVQAIANSLQEHSQFLKSEIDAMRTHGLIGT